MTPADFLPKALQAARSAGHLFPEYAACEAALESGWGASGLAVHACNLFGMKEPKDPYANHYPTIWMPTQEWDTVEQKMVPTEAKWPLYPSWDVCFTERMNTLMRLPDLYGEAISAETGEEFVRRVSKHWSTDPERANKVIAIYNRHRDLLTGNDKKGLTIV